MYRQRSACKRFSARHNSDRTNVLQPVLAEKQDTWSFTTSGILEDFDRTWKLSQDPPCSSQVLPFEKEVTTEEFVEKRADESIPFDTDKLQQQQGALVQTKKFGRCHAQQAGGAQKTEGSSEDRLKWRIHGIHV